MTPRLELKSLSRRFGGLKAVSDVSFEVFPNEIAGVIGPNGAGKTTLFNLIAGTFKPSGGSVLYDGRDVTGWASDAIARLGIGRTFQAVHAFKSETVFENLRRAGLLKGCHGPLAAASRWFSRGVDDAVDKVRQTAGFVGLSGSMDKAAGSLSYGQQKLLGIAMTLMQDPQLVLMDEPAAGLNPSEKVFLSELIARLRDERQQEVLIVEHDMRLIMSVCDRVLVVNQGCRIAVGTPNEIREDQAVIDAYLGLDYEFA